MKFIKIAVAAVALIAAPVLAGNAFAGGPGFGYGYGYGSPYAYGGVNASASLYGRSYHPRSNYNYGYRVPVNHYHRAPVRVRGCAPYGGGYGYVPRRNVGVGVHTPGFSLNIGRFGY